MSCLNIYASVKSQNNTGKIRTLNLGNLKLKSSGLPAAVGTSEASGTPRRATMDLREVSELLEGVGVAKRNEDQAVMDEGGHDAKVGTLLTT